MQVVSNENTVTVTISKNEIELVKLISSYLESTEQASTIFKELPIETKSSIDNKEPIVVPFEEIPAVEESKVEPVKKETTTEHYARLDLEQQIIKAKWNFNRVGVTIINNISDIPVLEKGDKGVKDEKKIDIKCAIAKVLGYYVKGKQVYSPHRKPLTNKITYKFKKGEPNAGEQLQLDAESFRNYLIKLEYLSLIKEQLKNEKVSVDTSDSKNEKEVLNDIQNASNDTTLEDIEIIKDYNNQMQNNLSSSEYAKVHDRYILAIQNLRNKGIDFGQYMVKPHFTAKEVAKHIEATKPTITHPYQIDSKIKKVKAGGQPIPTCVGFWDLDFDQQNEYVKWWYEVGQKLYTTEIAEITI